MKLTYYYPNAEDTTSKEGRILTSVLFLCVYSHAPKCIQSCFLGTFAKREIIALLQYVVNMLLFLYFLFRCASAKALAVIFEFYLF